MAVNPETFCAGAFCQVSPNGKPRFCMKRFWGSIYLTVGMLSIIATLVLVGLGHAEMADIWIGVSISLIGGTLLGITQTDQFMKLVGGKK